MVTECRWSTAWTSLYIHFGYFGLSDKGFTDILIVNEDSKSLNALTHIHLPYGPTAYYKLTRFGIQLRSLVVPKWPNSVKLAKDIKNCARPINAKPEVVTRMFFRVWRFIILHRSSLTISIPGLVTVYLGQNILSTLLIWFVQFLSMLSALFGVRPDFKGRRVATFHNQRWKDNHMLCSK